MRRFIAAGLLALLATQAEARIVEFRVLEQHEVANGRAFGTAGQYVRIRALARGELDPADPANANIRFLKGATRNPSGLVEYTSEVEVLRPADPGRGNGILLFDVPAMGQPSAPSWLDETAGSGREDPFTLRRGYTLVSAGWQADAPPGADLLHVQLPVTTWAELPFVERIRHEFQFGTRAPESGLRVALPYPTANIERASLTVRSRPADPPTPIPIEDWRFVDSGTIQLAPYGTPFEPRRIYEFTYQATRPTAVGIGFAAVRDVVGHLRRTLDLRYALGFGVGLGGRFLRHFLELGMNKDEAGARVFDGMLMHAAGAGKVFGNELFAQPARSVTQHEDHWYPEIWEPLGYPDLLPNGGADPVVIESNSSTEYWQKAASAVHTTRSGADAPAPDGVRLYLVAGTAHSGSATPGACANPRNPASAGPVLRAMLVNLEDWAVHARPPPPTTVPMHATGTGVRAAAIRMPSIPGVTWAPGDNQVPRDTVDWVDPQTESIRVLPSLVPAVDADGNEVAGIKLPHLAAPLGTFAGVNVYKDLPTELCDQDGTFVPFARTRAERMRTGDPRPSLQERYGSRDAYVALVAAAASGLVAERLLLPEDAQAYIAAARRAEGF